MKTENGTMDLAVWLAEIERTAISAPWESRYQINKGSVDRNHEREQLVQGDSW